MGSSDMFQPCSKVPKSEQLALGDAELAFAVDLLAWLCQRRIIGSFTMRNAMLEIRKYPETGSAISKGPLSGHREGKHKWS